MAWIIVGLSVAIMAYGGYMLYQASHETEPEDNQDKYIL